MVISSLVFFAANPDKEVWWGKLPTEARQELYASRELAKQAGALDIWPVHETFRWWFLACAISTTILWVTGFIRNCYIDKSYRHSKKMRYTYWAAWGQYVLMIIGGIIVRFGEEGMFACGDGAPRNLTFNSDPHWKW